MPNETTTAAATAGAALGGIIGWTISALTGVDTAPISGGLATLGAFTFGLVFPR
jgi:outer membrane lipoprotein SlyB